jgi:hypothetical protein
MIIKSIDYKQFKGKRNEWHLKNCVLSNINLLVGKNASGKTRTLNIIKGLGDIFSRIRKLQFSSGDYNVLFLKDSAEFVYKLLYEKANVINENLFVNKVNMMDRGPEGKGNIYAEEVKKKIQFQIPTDEVAVLAKKDVLQHPFLNDLYLWGKDLKAYYFGTPLGKDYFYSDVDAFKSDNDIDYKDANQVARIYTKGIHDFGESYSDLVLKDMENIGYRINNIQIGKMSGIITKQPLMGILLKESDLKTHTEQFEASQGMFRAFSLLCQINYGLMSSNISCILIDDIGEGLDFDRSTRLIKMIIRKAQEFNQQIIMSTNDRFVMNNVPLEYWSVIIRRGNVSEIYNYNNAKEIFDEFKLTGLNNFDLYSSDYLERKLK